MPGKFLANLSNFRLFNNQNNIKVDPKVIAEIKFKTPPANVVFEYISKGVSAAEDTATGEKYIKVEAGTKYKIVGEIVINGKTYPKIEFIE